METVKRGLIGATGLAVSVILASASLRIFAEGGARQDIDYHAVPPTADVLPYVLPPEKAPEPSNSRLWEMLRTRVKYVFVIYQENRSFDSYFGTFPGADGLFSRAPGQTPGFEQEFIKADGTKGSIHPFRIGPREFAADLDDADHSHVALVAKMNVGKSGPKMDQFAEFEERKHTPSGNPSLQARQFGELAMAYVDGDTVPFLWRYANRFVLYDHIFQLMVGPSTPGNLSILAAQSGATQWVLHPEQAYAAGASGLSGVPVLNDSNPFWGSPLDHFPLKMPINPRDYKGKVPPAKFTERNLTFASIPLTLRRGELEETVKADSDPDDDLADVRHDMEAINNAGGRRVGFGWYQEGYDRESTDQGPTDAAGLHASYITHHNGPQYFGYISNNSKMREDLHGLGDFFAALDHKALPQSGGVFFLKGGYQNTLGLDPADPEPAAQKAFLGDDDHPAYSDSQISEALVAEAINRIAGSPYWKECAVIVTWDDSEGQYDHVPPPNSSRGPDGTVISNGPRVPFLLISPFARVHWVCHAIGNHASVVKFIDKLFGLVPLAKLPDELHARQVGLDRYGQSDLGPADALTPGVTDLAAGFDPARLDGSAAPLPAAYAEIPETLVHKLPQRSGYGCRQLGITPVDQALGIKNEIPADFNPRPKTTPTKG